MLSVHVSPRSSPVPFLARGKTPSRSTSNMGSPAKLEDGTLKYSWVGGDKADMEARRTVLQDEMSKASDDGKSEVLESLMVEWMALLEARHHYVETAVHKDNTKRRQEGLAELWTMICKLKQTELVSKPTHQTLMTQMNGLSTGIEEYFKSRSIEGILNVPEIAPDVAPVVFMAPPPPPPPPPPQTQQERKEYFIKKIPKHQTAMRDRKPLQSVNSNLMDSIRKDGLVGLKRTAFKRSPGGTPMRRKRSADDGNLLSVALKNKFKNCSSPFASPAGMSPFNSPFGGTPGSANNSFGY